MGQLLFESNVIDAVCAKLESKGYEILRRRGPKERGDDIVAVRKSEPLRELHIEAKGETSSRRGSGRYGSPFSSAQIRVHVAEALYKAAEILSGNYEVVTISLKDADTEVRAGVALPDTEGHRRCIANITPVLEQLGIAVFWVQKNGDVQVVAPWEV